MSRKPLFDEYELKKAKPKEPRIAGFYWVRLTKLSEYEIAKWAPGHGWSMFWTDQYLQDIRLHEIDERRIVREEKDVIPDVPVSKTEKT